MWIPCWDLMIFLWCLNMLMENHCFLHGVKRFCIHSMFFHWKFMIIPWSHAIFLWLHDLGQGPEVMDHHQGSGINARLRVQESKWLSISSCDFDMIASSWSVEQRALGPWLEPRAQGSGLIAHGSVAMGQGHLARGQSADDRGQESEFMASFSAGHGFRIWVAKT